MFAIPELTVQRIHRNDESAMRDLQSLLERCSDYYELHEGEPPGASAATDEFDLPERFSSYEVVILGYRNRDNLIAEMSLLRDYPTPGEWWMALFVVDPAMRGRGLGARICEGTFAWLKSLGGTTMVLAADEENPRGQKFWQSLGFVETGRRDTTAATGMHRRVIIMRRLL